MNIRDCFDIAGDPYLFYMSGDCNTYSSIVMVVDSGIGTILSYPYECEVLTPTIYDHRYALLSLKKNLGDSLTFEKWLQEEHDEACAPLSSNILALMIENQPRLNEAIEMQEAVLEDLLPFKNLPEEEKTEFYIRMR